MDIIESSLNPKSGLEYNPLRPFRLRLQTCQPRVKRRWRKWSYWKTLNTVVSFRKVHSPELLMPFVKSTLLAHGFPRCSLYIWKVKDQSVTILDDTCQYRMKISFRIHLRKGLETFRTS